MFRNRVIFAAALCAVLDLSLPIAAENQYYAYEPHYLSGVEDASNQVKFFSPHFAPLEILKKWGGTSSGLTSGYSLVSADVNQLGINLSFSKSGVNQKTQYFWSWDGGYVAPVSTPYKDDVVTSIVFADIKFFEIWNFHEKGMPAPWCVVPNGHLLDQNSEAQNNVVCVVTQKDAQGLIDAMATLVVASGGNLEPSPGMFMGRRTSAKDLQKHPEQACRVGWVHTDGPPARAGIQVGDILQSLNGKPCTGEESFQDAIKMAASGSGDVHVEVLRKGQSLALDLHYANPNAGVAQLRQKTSAVARHPVGSVVQVPADASAPAAPASPIRLGFQVRAVTEADVTALGLLKSKGAVVTGVEKGGLADQMQIQIEDVIVEVNGSEIGDVDFLGQFVRSGAAKSFRVWRKGQFLQLTVPQSM
jgi:hypothetical protein